MKDVVLKINPFGMTLTGIGTSDLHWYAPQTVKTVLETTKGDIELKDRDGSRSNPEGPYELTQRASTTIDLDRVIAIRIGDNRIPLKQALRFPQNSSVLTDEKRRVRLCKRCGKPFIAADLRSAYCSTSCRNVMNVKLSRHRKRETDIHP